MPSNWVQICDQPSPDFSPCVPKLGVKLGPFAPVSQHTRTKMTAIIAPLQRCTESTHCPRSILLAIPLSSLLADHLVHAFLAFISASTLIKWAKSDEVRDCRGHLSTSQYTSSLLLSGRAIKILSLSSQCAYTAPTKIMMGSRMKMFQSASSYLVRLIDWLVSFQLCLIWITQSVSESLAARKEVHLFKQTSVVITFMCSEIIWITF